MDLDNEKLENLIRNMDMGKQESDTMAEFFEIFKSSHLFMPVILSDDFFENIENSKPGDVFTTTERSGFDINYINLDDDKKAVPLFTSDEIMQSTGIKSSAIGINMGDLADMLKQAPDRYFMIIINPFTDLTVEIPTDSFLKLFYEDDEFSKVVEGISNLLHEKSVELEDNYLFYLRSDDNFMKDLAENGVFIPPIPFNMSSKVDFHEDFKYLNIIAMPEGSKILFLGDAAGEDNFDTILAPESELHLVEEKDEFTTVWECRNQPFYN